MITQQNNIVKTYLKSAHPCLIVSNNSSGKGKQPSPQILMEYFDLSEPFIVYDGSQDMQSFQNILVSGGDGTISRVVNLCGYGEHNIFYNPNGTVNDFGKINKQVDKPIIGAVNGKKFCYVLAAGTLTCIGYTATHNQKVKMGKLAYILQSFKHFKIQNISASIVTQKNHIGGNYTLIMFLRSNRCFGFRFNKLFDPNKKELYMLLVDTPKSKITLFFRFFRVFFIGFRHEYKKHGITFEKVNFADVSLQSSMDFCLDGEQYRADANINVSPVEFGGTIKTR